MLLTRIFTFDAAHALTHYYGKCERMHGHTYRLEVTVEGEVGANGMVLDFLLLKRVVKRRVLDHLDHQNLNDRFENPSCELIAKWIWEQLEDLQNLVQQESEDPNLSEDLRNYLEKDELSDLYFVQPNVKLYQVKLWEGEHNAVTIGV